MRYCVSGRQFYTVLKKADEIKVKYKDRERLIDFVEKLPNKTIILDLDEIEYDLNLKQLQMYKEKFNDFYLAIHDLRKVIEIKEYDIKWYWPYPVTSYYELNQILRLNPSYVFLGAPLTSDLPKVRKLIPDNIKIRMVANCASPQYLKTSIPFNNIIGSWVRPEDVEFYELYVDCLEFDNLVNGEPSTRREETLLRIYQEDKKWPGNLNLIINDLNVDVDNRLLPEEWSSIRSQCGMKCMSGLGCRFCNNVFRTAEIVKKLS